MANLNFNAHEVDPAVGFEPIPAGKYTAIISESEMKPTKSGTGEYLQLTFQVVEGEYKGRLLWARLNLVNRNETAVKIARAELSAICRAVGVMAPRDSSELHNLSLTLSVVCTKRADNNELSNDIKAYASRQHVAPVAAPVGSETPPWRQ